MCQIIQLWPESGNTSSAEASVPYMEAYPVTGSAGAVIICPGGAYSHRAAHEGAPVARMLNTAGISAYVLQYSVAPCPHGTSLREASRAIRSLRYMGYKKVAILGFSAGANLACNAAVHYDRGDSTAQDPVERFSSRPDQFISCYGVVSLVHMTHHGSLVNLLGAEDANQLELAMYYSAEQQVTEDTPPAFIWHTAQDPSVSVENSLNLALSLKRKNVPFEVHIFPFGRHGIGLAENDSYNARWSDLLKAWLLMYGYGLS